MISRGFQIIQEDNAFNVLELIEMDKYNVVFTGLDLPDVNGYELLIKIRKSAGNMDTPVILLLKPDQILDFKKAKQLGAEQCIFKPLNENKIESTLDLLGL
jgi:PleD family two-component response regulator